ncbi:MAG: aldo/keto reductase [Oscillospiraceae bacterium]|nr:aldo/keto reductase [Oscillospiraceae bacterium]
MNPAAYPAKKLGFGFMRLPLVGGVPDDAYIAGMVDRFLEDGLTYFDTAYTFFEGESERCLKRVLVERHARDSFLVADKLPSYRLASKDDPARFEREQCERLGVSYFDYYLLHCLNEKNIALCEEFGAVEHIFDMKRRGTARRIGFSFHGTPAQLDAFLTKYPAFEFVQLQINYIDWDDPAVCAGECYAVARRHNKPVAIMEPVKGGALSALAPNVRALLDSLDPDASSASFAMRFAGSLDGVYAVLSGMNSQTQLLDNMAVFDRFRALDDRERAVLGEVVQALRAIPTIPCTGCAYCKSGCPVQMDIPGIIGLVNNYAVYGHLESAKRTYELFVGKPTKASDCLGCGACESVCPQGIEITDALKKAADLFDRS